MSVQEIYMRCLYAHALNWLDNYQKLDPIEYLDLYAGPIISHLISVYTLEVVVNDFLKQVDEIR